MAATIKIKNSSTASAVPTSSDLVQGELAVNVTDKRIFTENASGTVVELGTNPSILTLPDGSASAPTLTNDGDTNTGIFFPAADTVGIATGGTERLRLDSSGNLGLGVTSPSGRLDVQNNQNSTSNFYFRNTDTTNTSSRAALNVVSGTQSLSFLAINGDNTFIQRASGSLQFQLSGSTQALIDSSGNLGIGTTSPTFADGKGIHLNNSSGASRFHLTNNTTGTTATDGSEFTVAGSDLYIINNESATMQFWTAATERARIDSSGNLLVGTTSVLQSSQVSISSSGKPLLCLVNAASTTGTPAARFVKYDNNTTTSNKLIDFEINAGSAGSGQINANGANAAAFGSYSDARLKENIVDLSPQLENILALRPAEFDYIESEGGGHQIGFIAQEMQTVYPDVIGEDEDGMLTITGWSKTEARLVKAIQEQQAIITQLQADVAALKG